MSLLYAKSDSYSNADVNQLKFMRPTTIWFTQRKISQLFGNGWKSLVDTFGDVASGKIRVEDLPPISVFFHNERYWVFSGNRRLRVLQELEKYHLVDVIPVYVVNPPVQNFDSFWSLATAARPGPQCEVKIVRKQREVPIHFKFACCYLFHRFLLPLSYRVAIVYFIFVILFCIREGPFGR